MPRTYIKIEYFEFIEKKGSVTIDEFANKFWIKRNSAASWLSTWAGKGYLKSIPVKGRVRFAGDVGRPKVAGYTIGQKWWGDLVYGASNKP